MTQKIEVSDLKDRYLPEGEVVADRFRVGEQIGEGPFGHVYRAEDTLVETEVAIKVFSDEVVDTPLDEEQFLKATRQARALTQQNVVRLHDSGIHEDHPWVSMQRLEGLNLEKVARLRWQRDESFGIPELEPILSQITLALQHISRDFPHGNLKPKNIIFLPDLLKVTDSYVMAALPGDVFAERNADSPFVAPELADGDFEADARCDVYSVGALVGYLLFGPDYEPGTQGDAPGGLSAVDTLCKRAMAEDPDERYGAVEALNEDFTSVVDTGALLERRPTAAGADVPTPPGAPDADSEPATAGASSARGSQSSPDGPDPLDVETSSDIGMPLEDDISTTEYDREENAELGDYLPTNEVDRDQLEQMETNEVDRDQLDAGPPTPPPGDQPAGEPPPPEADEPRPPDQSTESEAPDAEKPEGDDPDLEEADAEEAERDEPPAETRAEDQESDRETRDEQDESSGLPLPIAGAAAVLIAVFVGVVFAAVIDDPDEADAEAEPTAATPQDDHQDEDPDKEVAEEPGDEEEEEEEEADRIPEELREAVGLAAAEPLEAHDEALDAAEERAEEIEAERQEQEAEREAAAGAGARPGGAGQPADCPSGMVQIHAGGQHVCIDAYQYPGRGHMPKVNVSWFDAKRLCEQQDKRLCTHQEWQSACGSVYPYGTSFDPDRCNTADEAGFDRSLAETGSFPECRSPSGAYDMSGNAHEWVEEQRVAGGAFDSRADTARCDYSSAMSPGSARGNVGFRCCTTPS